MSSAAITHLTKVDDDGSGTTGTVVDAAYVELLEDNIDTALDQIIQTKTATYTLVATDDCVLFTTAGVTLDLPAANSVGEKRFEVVNGAATGNVTIDPNGGELIDGGATYVMGPGEGVVIRSTGSAWRIVAIKPGTGTWTISVGGTATYTANTGQWVKKGREVTVSGFLHINVIGTGSTGIVTGLPFTPAENAAGTVGYFANIASSLVFCSCYARTTPDILFTGLTAAAASVANPAVVFGSNASIYFSVTYRV